MEDEQISQFAVEYDFRDKSRHVPHAVVQTGTVVSVEDH